MSRRDIRFLGGRSHRSTSGFALRWVFIFCSVAFVLLVQSPSQSDAKIQDFQVRTTRVIYHCSKKILILTLMLSYRTRIW